MLDEDQDETTELYEIPDEQRVVSDIPEEQIPAVDPREDVGVESEDFREIVQEKDMSISQHGTVPKDLPTLGKNRNRPILY